MSSSQTNPPVERRMCRSAAALVFGTRGIQGAVMAGEEILTLDLPGLALSPPRMITVKKDVATPDDVPRFPTLLERVGEDDLVTLAGRTERPHVHLSSLIQEATRALQHGWGPFDALAMVVSAYATDLQRSLILKAAHKVGWRTVELVHKTTAVALEALQQLESGKYLILVLDHEAAEASVVEWLDRNLRAVSYSIARELSGSELGRVLLHRTFERLGSSGGGVPPLELYTPRDWIWLQQRIQQVREQLDLRSRIRLEIPAALTTGATAEVAFERADLERCLAPLESGIKALIERCCAEARQARTDLKGIVVSGSLLRQASVLEYVRSLSRETSLILCAPDARSRGACRLAAEGSDQGSPPQKLAKRPVRKGVLPLPDELHLDAQFPEAFEHPIPTGQEPVGANSIIDKVRALVGSGRRDEAKQALAPLKEYIEALELSLQEPGVALERVQTEPAKSPPDDPQPSPAEPGHKTGEATEAQPTEAERPHDVIGQADQKTNKRRYVLARDDLKKAEKALREGNMEYAVRLSHRAYETSKDGRIFGAMIEVHLRAARRLSSTPENFEDHRRWLLCALSDDGTNHKIQEAMSKRFLIHAEQLVERGTEKDHSEAISTLHELAQHDPANELVQRWLQELKEAVPGSLKLTP